MILNTPLPENDGRPVGTRTPGFSRRLLQLRVFRFRSDEDGDVLVCVFPEREEILIGRLGFGGVASHGVGSSELQMYKCANRQVLHNSAMVEDFLEFGRGFAAMMHS